MIPIQLICMGILYIADSFSKKESCPKPQLIALDGARPLYWLSLKLARAPRVILQRLILFFSHEQDSYPFTCTDAAYAEHLLTA